PQCRLCAAAGGRRGSDRGGGPLAERQRVGGCERGRVGRGVGPGPPDDRDAEPARTDREQEAEHEHGEHQHADRAEFARPTVHFSTRMVALACNSGSANSAPTSGRSVTDVYRTVTVTSPPIFGRAPTSTLAPGSVRRAARTARPLSGSTLAARAASRAACTTPI